LPGFHEIYEGFYRSFLADNSLSFLNELRKTEPYIKELNIIYIIVKIPWLLRQIIAWIIKKKEPRLAKMLLNSKQLDAS